MAVANELVITLPGGKRVDAQVGRHVLHTDQPATNGGADSAPSPFELFLASVGACAGIFIQGFCEARGIPFDRIRIVERPRFGADRVLAEVDLEVQLPEDFPSKYREAVLKVAEQCSVKKAISAQPTIRLKQGPLPPSMG